MEVLSSSWPARLAMAVGPLLALLIYLPEQDSDEKVAESGPGAPA